MWHKRWQTRQHLKGFQTEAEFAACLPDASAAPPSGHDTFIPPLFIWWKQRWQQIKAKSVSGQGQPYILLMYSK